MRRAIYDSAMRRSRFGGTGALLLLGTVIFLHATRVAATDWNTPARQLAAKIAAFTGPGVVGFTVQNRSGLENKEVEAITAGLRARLEASGVKMANAESAAGSVTVFLSENPQAYVWVAEMQMGSQSGVAMVSVERNDGGLFPHESGGMTIRKVPLWTQENRILDVAVLEEDTEPKLIAVLDGEKVGLYRRQSMQWQQEQVLRIAHARPWPRDLRGRLVAAKDHLLDVYLPGVFCRTSVNLPLSLDCHESDDPWPLVVSSPTSFPSYDAGAAGNAISTGFSGAVPQLDGFYAPTRNFFTGALAPAVGKIGTTGKFYSAAPLPREKYVLWLFAGVDGQIHLVDGIRDQAARLNWGSDVASVKTACGSGWQVLATSAANGSTDTVRAYEVPDRDPVPVSAPLEIPGEITALWTEAKGDSAIAIARNRETENYEAFRLAVACGQ